MIKYDIKDKIDLIEAFFKEYQEYFMISKLSSIYMLIIGLIASLEKENQITIARLINNIRIEFNLDFKYNIKEIKEYDLRSIFLLENSNKKIDLSKIDSIELTEFLEKNIRPFIEEFIKRVKYSIKLKYIKDIKEL